MSRYFAASEGANDGRVVSIPAGMTLAKGLRMLGGYSEGEIAQAAELRPEPLNVATMLMLKR